MSFQIETDYTSRQSPDGSASPGQVLCFVSAKGGTGKTVLSASTTYALSRSGMRVVAIDTDFSTRGLSLFLLGSVLESHELHIQSKHCLADSILEGTDIKEVTPLKLVHGALEYHVVISNKDVFRGGVPDERFLGSRPQESGTTPHPDYFDYLKRLCDHFRTQYDYVILDTRGGYDLTSAAPATIADGYVIVLEADRVSVEQVSGFKKKMDDYAASLIEIYPRVQPFLKGFIVNKALFSVDDKVFPEALAREYDSRTFGVIPVDKDVIRAYQKKTIPQENFPDSDFSYFSLRAIESLLSPSQNWSAEKAERFRRFLSFVRSAWSGRRRLEIARQAAIPIALLLLALLSSILYLFFKSNSAGYSPQGFYVTSTIFVLLANFGAVLATLSYMQTIDASKAKRKVMAAFSALFLVWLAYLAVFDIPKAFSQGPLLQRIREREAVIASQEEEMGRLTREASTVKTENEFLKADKVQVETTLAENDKQINDQQNEIASLKTQVSAIKRDRDSAQNALSNAEQQAATLRTSLSECQRRCR